MSVIKSLFNEAQTLRWELCQCNENMKLKIYVIFNGMVF